MKQITGRERSACARSYWLPMKPLILLLLAIMSFCSMASARITPYFSYEDLMEKSDLVVVMEHISTAPTANTDEQGGRGQLTTAKVLLVLKGKIDSKDLSIEHFYYPILPSSPNPIVFPSPQASRSMMQSARSAIFIEPTRQYLAFMKLQKNGTYTSVTPHFDSSLSFLPVGGNLNDLWTVMVQLEEGDATEKPPRVRKFVEVPAEEK